MVTPVRRLVKPTTPRTVHLLNLRGILPAPVQAEATTESAFVLLAALCPACKHIASQPITVELDERRYTPDYRIETQQGELTFWEVKLEARIDSYRELFASAATHFHAAGQKFFAISERQLRRSRQHECARLVLRYGKARYPSESLHAAVSHMQALPKGLPLGDLMERVAVPKEHIFHLLAHRRLTFARGISTTPDTQIIHPEFLEACDANYLARWFGVSPWRPNV
ncbi:hypothetical protein ACS5PK_22100 [Roseateles sp. DB2]|uniref:hypothetical protein n=1 Tax=Roseateles sp. DB2 TaxID=3453717 RepID=UPI003EEC1DCF